MPSEGTDFEKVNPFMRNESPPTRRELHSSRSPRPLFPTDNPQQYERDMKAGLQIRQDLESLKTEFERLVGEQNTISGNNIKRIYLPSEKDKQWMDMSETTSKFLIQMSTERFAGE